MNNQRLVLSWENIQGLSVMLSRQLENHGFDQIIAVARGGLFPASLISYALDIRVVDIVAVQSYDGQVRGEIKLLQKAEIQGKKPVIIDDLVDSGATMAMLRRLYPDVPVAVLLAKPEGRVQADFVVRDIPQNLWVDFPWEQMEAISKTLSDEDLEVMVRRTA